MGVLSDKEDECDGDQVRKERTRVFLCIKKGLMLEVDMQRGKERCRLELDSLARVETTDVSWTCVVRGGRDFWEKNYNSSEDNAPMLYI